MRTACRFWFCVAPMVFFVAKSLQGEVLPNWAMVAYLTGLIAFSAHYLRNFAAVGKHARRLAIAAVVVAAACTVVMHWPMGPMALWRQCAASIARDMGVDPHKLGADANPMKKVRGWAYLAQEVDRVARAHTRRPYFVFSDKYDIASSLAFYLEGNPRTYCVYQKRTDPNHRGRLERRVNQFDIWEDDARRAGGPVFGDASFRGMDAIFVTVLDRGDSPQLPDQLKKAFAGGYLTMVVRSPDEFGYDYAVFICHGFTGLPFEMPDSY